MKDRNTSHSLLMKASSYMNTGLKKLLINEGA